MPGNASGSAIARPPPSAYLRARERNIDGGAAAVSRRPCCRSEVKISTMSRVGQARGRVTRECALPSVDQSNTSISNRSTAGRLFSTVWKESTFSST